MRPQNYVVHTKRTSSKINWYYSILSICSKQSVSHLYALYIEVTHCKRYHTLLSFSCRELLNELRQSNEIGQTFPAGNSIKTLIIIPIRWGVISCQNRNSRHSVRQIENRFSRIKINLASSKSLSLFEIKFSSLIMNHSLAKKKLFSMWSSPADLLLNDRNLQIATN